MRTSRERSPAAPAGPRSRADAGRPPPASRPRARWILDHPVPAVLLAALHAALVAGFPVPWGNELVYLPPLEPSMAAGDWSYQGFLRDRIAFTLIFGPLAQAVGLEAAAWIGRALATALSLWGAFRLGRGLGLPWLAIGVAIALWLAYGQSTIGGEWVIGTFEAKCLAWAAVFHGLADAMAGRTARAGAMAGLAVTMHPAAGLVAGAGLAAAVLALRLPPRALARPAAWAALAGLPGGIQTAAQTVLADPATVQDWEFVGLLRLPNHLEPLAFSRGLAGVTVAMAGFVLWMAWQRRDRREWAALGAFTAGVAAVFAAGLGLRAAGRWDLLALTPFRVFPVIALLGFLLAAAAWIRERPPGWGLPVLAAFCLLGLPDLPREYREGVDKVRAAWNAPADDWTRAFAWVAGNTPRDAVGILPPWRADATWTAGRGAVAWWELPRYDHLPEWRARMEALGGGPDFLEWARLRGVRDVAIAEDRLRAGYGLLDAATLAKLGREWGATFVVARQDLALPVLQRVGTVTVYALPGGSRPAGGGL